jgi:hypothetical protein
MIRFHIEEKCQSQIFIQLKVNPTIENFIIIEIYHYSNLVFLLLEFVLSSSIAIELTQHTSQSIERLQNFSFHTHVIDI